MEGTTASVMPNASSASKLPHTDEFNPYFAYVGGGIFFFTVVNYLTRFTMPASSAGSFQGAELFIDARSLFYHLDHLDQNVLDYFTLSLRVSTV